MDEVKLDKAGIDAAIETIAQLDLQSVTSEQLNEIVAPLFNGLVLSAPILPEGTYIYRGRVCEKPEHYKQLIYPQPEYVTSRGRANDIGEPMFYGSVGKSIPFFELRAQAGDTIIMTIWRTTKPLTLNHVGFTQEVAELLNSNRDLENIHNFVKATKDHSDLNAFVYNYLGKTFSKRNDEDTDQDYYKLTKAIARALTFGFIDGIIYPTVAMFANAENIVLKPSSFDNNLEFVSLEFMEVTERIGDQLKLNTLDTAVKFDAKQQIIWTGKGFAWEGGPNDAITVGESLSEFIGRTESGRRLDPIPTAPLHHDISALEKRFRADFPKAFKVNGALDLSGNGEQVKPYYSINLDFQAANSTMSFYIPECNYPTELCIHMMGQVNTYLTDNNRPEIVYKNEFDNMINVSANDVNFTGQVYIYSESKINQYTLQANTPKEYHVSMIFARDLI